MTTAEPPTGPPGLYEVETGPAAQLTWRRRGLAGVQLLVMTIGLGFAAALLLGIAALTIALIVSAALN